MTKPVSSVHGFANAPYEDHVWYFVESLCEYPIWPRHIRRQAGTRNAGCCHSAEHSKFVANQLKSVETDCQSGDSGRLESVL